MLMLGSNVNFRYANARGTLGGYSGFGVPPCTDAAVPKQLCAEVASLAGIAPCISPGRPRYQSEYLATTRGHLS
jgi:hypothetical protein